MPAGQSYRERAPTVPLRRHLSSVWIQRVGKDAPPYTHRVVPHGSVELAVAMGSSPQLVGPQTAPRVETLAPGSTVVGVRFHPGVAPVILGVPASELVDRIAGWDELEMCPAAGIGEAVAGAASPEQAAAIVERAVFGLLADAAAPDPIVREAVGRLMPWSMNNVGSLACSLYVSERQLRRRMSVAVGLAPKVVQRVLRFQGFLALAHNGADLATLAADTGYADQAHLTREAVRLSGMTPRVLLQDAAERCVGVHDHAASRLPLLRARALARAA